jgi:cytochrome c553
MKLLTNPLALVILFASIWSIPVLAADLKAGAEKAENCAGCHGAKGQSSNPQVPNLAQQQTAYLVKQLSNFKSGERKNATMQAMAANLSEDDINNVAGHFSGLAAVKASGDAALAATGKTKAGMCLGCHGTDAAGGGQVPRLAGQQPEYIVQQLKNFKDGSRIGGPMKAVASNLSDDDMKEIAAYLSGL